ncbi:hypothetical protein JCM4814A_01240 [Streptomyces phaeofaciens JCM 4814]|uniref:Uncharacterized protein n=1 Tax=Streptomyces phaeofaciens TaxID=68254 RepID=A0A918HQ35_9ACTN|nr:hypothetical protein GCM10010226_85070 [Streptomyces phaeofaciens]
MQSRPPQIRPLVLMTAVVRAAGLFGWWLARRITHRLVILTAAAEDVARTRRLGVQVPVTGHDVGQVAAAPARSGLASTFTWNRQASVVRSSFRNGHQAQ